MTTLPCRCLKSWAWTGNGCCRWTRSRPLSWCLNVYYHIGNALSSTIIEINKHNFTAEAGRRGDSHGGFILALKPRRDRANQIILDNYESTVVSSVVWTGGMLKK
ncbi:MAG: hypothetical protein HQK96_03980 [Nitrospirae bacterium]|nr:hypothetical protein [Nitrospirota bacterium]